MEKRREERKEGSSPMWPSSERERGGKGKKEGRWLLPGRGAGRRE